MVWVQCWPASAAYALSKAATTPALTGAICAPIIRHAPGVITPEEPTFPVMVAGPTQVTAPPFSSAALRIAKSAAAPSEGADATADARMFEFALNAGEVMRDVESLHAAESSAK